jgi:hypothetical protein
MPTWILDDGPFDHLARSVPLEAVLTWPVGQLFIAEQTALDADSGSHRKSILDVSPSPVRSFSIVMGTAAFDVVHDHLRPRQGCATANLAEHQSIAWVISECPEGIFVVQDKKAAMLALAELGCGHVAHPHDLWLYLRDQEMIDHSQFEALCRTTCRKDQSGIPLRCQP